MTELEWGEANDKFAIAEAVYYTALHYRDRGWLSDEGYTYALAEYARARSVLDAAHRAYSSEDDMRAEAF